MKENKNTMTEQLESILKDVINSTDEDDKFIEQIDDETIQIKTQSYQLMADYREGFQLESFKERYQDFFEKYDFIVGDWGHEQLRLRGFYQIGRRKVPRDQQIDFLDDYIKEYCNFGCAYFVIGKIEEVEKFDTLKAKQAKPKMHTEDKAKQTSIVTQERNKDNSSTKPVNKRSNKSRKTFKKKRLNNEQAPPSRNEKGRSQKRSGNNFIIKKVKKD